MSRRKMHRHSLDAYVAGRVDLFPQRSRAILAWLDAHKSPATDREIREGLGFADMNAVRPRITELIAAGVLREVDAAKDPKTGKAVRRVDLAVRAGSQLSLI
jgi:hypothetical protein